MSSFDFDYEIKFTGAFDASIITVPEKDDILVGLIEQECTKLLSVLNLYAGVKVMSTFVDYQSKKYKITLEK
jgi:hypothetical protein